MLYARRVAHRAPPGRRKLSTAFGVATVLALLAVGIAQALPSSFLELDGNLVSNATGTYDWANSGALTSSTTAGGTWTRAGTGGVFDGGKFQGNTTPPTAPTRTATAAADASIADAEFKVDPLSVDVTSCGTGDPTVYTGAGSETNGDLLPGDTFGTGSVPNKDDLSNVYALAHVTASTNEVFFGAERVINNGDSHIDFEFLQSKVTIPNACSGSFTGDRTQGDFLMSVDFTTGGTLGGTTIYRWICDATYNAAHDNQVCNPPLHGKSVPHYEIFGGSVTTIAVNAGSTSIGCGGWVCRNPDGSSTTTLAQNELMEGGIDLKALGFTGCISTFLPHTRSSQSFTAVLKDFEIIPFNTCVKPTITTQLKLHDNTNATGDIPVGTQIHDTAQLHGATPDAGGTVTYKLYTDNTCTTLSTTPAVNQNVSVTNGVPLDSNEFTFNTAGNYWWQATYSGDTSTGGRNIGPTSSPCTSEPVTIVQYHPSVGTTIKNAAGAAVTTSQTIPVTLHDSATITNASPNAGGTITYKLFSTVANCTANPQVVLADLTPASNTVTAGVAPDSSPYTFNSAGTFFFYAVYSGDSFNVGPVNSGCSAEPVTILANTPSVGTTIKNAAGTAVTTSQSIPVTLHDSATITGATADAGGTITYKLFSTVANCTANPQVVLADLTPASNTVTAGVAPDSSPYTFNSAGTFYFYAVYSGDSNNTGPVNSGCSAEPVTILANTPSVGTTIKNAAGTAVTTAQSIPVTLHDSATITGATADAGGTITYLLFSSVANCTATPQVPLANLTPTVNAVTAGSAPDSKTFTFNSAGTFFFYAVYSGDSNNTGPVNSGCSAEPVTISPNSPVPHSTPVVQIKDTFSVTGFAAPAAGAPNIVVKLYGDSSCATTALQTTTLAVPAAGGTATGETVFIGELTGTYYYQMSYAGDNNNSPFTSVCTAESVNLTITSMP
jgi:hypothetical protein